MVSAQGNRTPSSGMARAARATAMRCLHVFLFLRRWEGAAVAGWLARRICLGSTCIYASLASVGVAILPLKHAVPAIASSIYPAAGNVWKFAWSRGSAARRLSGLCCANAFTPPQNTDARCVLEELSRMSVATALLLHQREKRGDLMGNRERGGALCLGMPAKPH